MPRSTINLELTAQEHAALSAALHTLLKLWGDSEDANQERIQAKLRSIGLKLEVLDAGRTHAGKLKSHRSTPRAIHSSSL